MINLYADIRGSVWFISHSYNWNTVFSNYKDSGEGLGYLKVIDKAYQRLGRILKSFLSHRR